MAEERTETQGFYEMLWDCDHCGTIGLLAKSQRHCANCGAKQNADKRYFPKEGESRRVDGHNYEGADRACGACKAPQSANARNCTHCGAPLDGASQIRGIAALREPAARTEKKPRRWWLLALIMALIGVAGTAIWYRFIRKRSEIMIVTAHHWERTIPIEEYNDVAEQTWRDSMPRDAVLSSCRPKKRSSRSIPDGEDCHTEKQDRKDGTFEVVKKCKPKYREEPVMGDWCSYKVRRWKEVPQSALRSAGTGLAPTSPAGAPPADTAATLGAKRAGAQRATYILVLGDQKCDVSESTWRKRQDGEKVKVQVRVSSGKIDCDSL
jgi:hypothetical protein